MTAAAKQWFNSPPSKVLATGFGAAWAPRIAAMPNRLAIKHGVLYPDQPSQIGNGIMARRSSQPATQPQPPGLPIWKLEDAKARFSEVVRLACEQGPQRVTVWGREAVVVVSAADYARLAPAAASPTLAALFADGPFARLEAFDDELSRGPEPFREGVDF